MMFPQSKLLTFTNYIYMYPLSYFHMEAKSLQLCPPRALVLENYIFVFPQNSHDWNDPAPHWSFSKNSSDLPHPIVHLSQGSTWKYMSFIMKIFEKW